MSASTPCQSFLVCCRLASPQACVPGIGHKRKRIASRPCAFSGTRCDAMRRDACRCNVNVYGQTQPTKMCTQPFFVSHLRPYRSETARIYSGLPVSIGRCSSSSGFAHSDPPPPPPDVVYDARLPHQAVTAYMEAVAEQYEGGLPEMKVERAALVMPRRKGEKVDLEVIGPGVRVLCPLGRALPRDVSLHARTCVYLSTMPASNKV